MQNRELTNLMSELGRLLSPRSSTPRAQALGDAYRRITAFAEVRHLDEEWCDHVMLIALSTQYDGHDVALAAA